MRASDDREDMTVTAPARAEPTPLDHLEPERYRVQFTATEEYVRLVEEAKALLSHAVPKVRLEELHLRAMRALVAELKKKKYAVSSVRGSSRVPSSVNSSSVEARGGEPTDSPAADAPPRVASMTRNELTDAPDELEQHDQLHTRRRGRYCPARSSD